MLKIKLAFALGLLTLLPNCAPAGGAASTSELTNSSFDAQSAANRRLPVPAPAPAPVPVAPPPPAVPPPAAGSDFVCTHRNGLSICNSVDTKINFDRMEKYVRDNNPNIDKAPYVPYIVGPKEAVICFSPRGSIISNIPGYPVSWICENGESGNLPESHGMTARALDAPSRLLASRITVATRPPGGFRSFRHNNAPFRCLGGNGYLVRTDYPGGDTETPTYSDIRTDMYCLFNNDVVTAESLSDAIAEANDFATHGNTRFKITCALKTQFPLIPGWLLNRVQINLLECKYSASASGARL